MINQLNIERYVLAKSRREGEQVLRDLGKAGNAWSADGYRLQRFPFVLSLSSDKHTITILSLLGKVERLQTLCGMAVIQICQGQQRHCGRPLIPKRRLSKSLVLCPS